MSEKVKRFNESYRLEVLFKLSQPNPPCKRSLARLYEMGETAIKKVWSKHDDIRQQSSLMSSDFECKAQKRTCYASADDS